MKKEINVFDYAGEICKAMSKGILLTTKSGDKVNTMTIGWGMIGIEWYDPIFIAYVRQTRHTKKMLEESGEFTVNVPVGEVDKHILSYCGTKSGADVDKFKELGLTEEEPISISAPGIRQLPLTLECKVLYAQDQDLNSIPQHIIDRFYPEIKKGIRDHHTAYYAKILKAYIITE